TSDSTLPHQTLNPFPTRRSSDLQVNYIRNSVKATVDAYSGEVSLYAWEPEEPLLQAWQNVYDTSIQPYSEMSAELMNHVRYPERSEEHTSELQSRFDLVCRLLLE